MCAAAEVWMLHARPHQAGSQKLTGRFGLLAAAAGQKHGRSWKGGVEPVACGYGSFPAPSKAVPGAGISVFGSTAAVGLWQCIKRWAGVLCNMGCSRKHHHPCNWEVQEA